MMRGTCKTCGRPVLFLQGCFSNELVTIDPAETPDGTISICQGKAKVFLRGLFEQIPAGPYYNPHSVTCKKLRIQTDSV